MACVFCGSRGKMSYEDAWPRWIRTVRPDFADESGAYKGSVGTELEHLPRAKFLRRVKCVCKLCNEGWMSDLEEVAKPFLTAMLKNRNRTLFVIGQRIVATWAYKTALMVRLITMKEADLLRKDLPDEHYKYLFQHGEPPREVTIWLARYIGVDWVTLFRETSHPIAVVDRNNVNDMSVRAIYGETLVIGNLVFQIFGHSCPPATGRLVIQPVAGATERLIRIWPPPFDGARVDWPPPVDVDDAGIEEFTSFMRAVIDGLPDM